MDVGRLSYFGYGLGQRLKEAGNINKSLMVLGQCMETLRLNQLKADMGKVGINCANADCFSSWA